MLPDKITRGSKANRKTTAAIVGRAHAEVAVNEQVIKTLGADVFALKLFLPALLNRIGRLDPILGSAIQQGFEDATDQIEHMISSGRWSKTRDRRTSALASIRRLRAAYLPG